MHNLGTVTLIFYLLGGGFCRAQLSDLPAPSPSTILQLTVGADIKVTIAGTNSSWLCIPEFSSNLMSQVWARVPFYSNTVANGTNIMEFDRLDRICGSNVFFRIRQTTERGAAYQGPPPLVANTWGYAGTSINAGGITNIVAALRSSGATNAGTWTIVIDEGWLTASGRDINGVLIGDTNKFPSGLKNLSKWLHQEGFKFGLYYHCGTNSETAGFFGGQASIGTFGYVEQDAHIMATNLCLDYVKLNYASSYIELERNTEIQQTFLKAFRETGTGAFVWIMPHLTPPNLYPSWMTNWGNDWRAYGLEDGNAGAWSVTLYNWDLVSKWFADIRPTHLLSIEGAIAYTSYPPRLDLLKSTMNMWAMCSAQRIVEGVSAEAAQYFTNAEVNAMLEDVGPAFLLSQTTNSSSLCDEWVKPLRNGSKAIMFLNRSRNGFEFTVASTNLNMGTTNVIGFRDPWIGSFVSTNALWHIIVAPESAALFVAVPGPIPAFPQADQFFLSDLPLMSETNDVMRIQDFHGSATTSVGNLQSLR